MAVIVTALDAKVQVKLNVGVDSDGDSILRTKTYTKIKSTASDQDIFDCISALMALQDHMVESVKCVSEESYMAQV